MGVISKSVTKGSPAERAGLHQGDVVASVAGKVVKEVNEAMTILGQVTIGDNVKIVVRRGGKATEFSVKAE